MTAIKIEPSSEGKLWVTLPYSEIGVARLKRIPGHWWNPERKQWQLPDTQETRAVLAEIVALKPESRAPMHSVAPRRDGPLRQARARYIPGKSKPLTTNPPHPLIKTVDDELVLRNMAYGTRKSYGQHLRNYFDWLHARGITPEHASAEQVRGYFVGMAESGLASAGYCNQARAALGFLYATVLQQEEKVCGLPQAKRPEQLPTVLSAEEVARLFQVTSNLKHLALLMLAYSAGLRVSVVVRLRGQDIDSDRMQVRIEGGKGKKDRYTLLSQVALQVLRDYYRAYKPKTWLFVGEADKAHLSTRSAQQIFQDARKRAGIRKPATFHSLRHSFATHLLENGVDVRYIQDLLGHKDVKTTERYTHITQSALGRIASPLDKLFSGSAPALTPASRQSLDSRNKVAGNALNRG